MRNQLIRLRDDVREIVTELIEFHELAYEITRRDLRLRYKQTVMGLCWAICMPVVNMLLFGMVFTHIVRIETGYPYAIFAYTGLLPWSLFAGSLRFAASSVTGSAGLIKKVYFPREILPYSAMLVCLVDFLVAALVLIGLLGYYRIAIEWTALLLPVLLIVQLLFTAGIALILAMGNLFFRDVKYLTELGITVWMFGTPVVYPVDQVTGTLGRVLRLNPMTPIIDGYRAVLLRGEYPAAIPLILATAIAVTVFVVAAIGFHRAEAHFAERA
jgi:lipopolysaccharide transport system permease protein